MYSSARLFSRRLNLLNLPPPPNVFPSQLLPWKSWNPPTRPYRRIGGWSGISEKSFRWTCVCDRILLDECFEWNARGICACKETEAFCFKTSKIHATWSGYSSIACGTVTRTSFENLLLLCQIWYWIWKYV